MGEINPLDELDLKLTMRQLIKDKGILAGYRVMYELIVGARIMAEVIDEEKKKGLES